MARKTVCLVGADWSVGRALKRNCRSREHKHIDPETARAMVKSGEARWLVGGYRRGRVEPGSVVQDRVEALKQKANRLSLEVGETHAMMIYDGNRTAISMLEEIHGKRQHKVPA